jgi:hypothetical protein
MATYIEEAILLAVMDNDQADALEKLGSMTTFELDTFRQQVKRLEWLILQVWWERKQQEGKAKDG